MSCQRCPLDDWLFVEAESPHDLLGDGIRVTQDCTALVNPELNPIRMLLVRLRTGPKYVDH